MFFQLSGPYVLNTPKMSASCPSARLSLPAKTEGKEVDVAAYNFTVRSRHEFEGALLGVFGTQVTLDNRSGWFNGVEDLVRMGAPLRFELWGRRAGHRRVPPAAAPRDENDAAMAWRWLSTKTVHLYDIAPHDVSPAALRFLLYGPFTRDLRLMRVESDVPAGRFPTGRAPPLESFAAHGCPNLTPAALLALLSFPRETATTYDGVVVIEEIAPSPLRRLALVDCPRLDDATFAALCASRTTRAYELAEVVVRDMPQLTDWALHSLVQWAPNAQTLRLRGLPRITARAIAACAPSLRHLVLEDATEDLLRGLGQYAFPVLERIDVAGPWADAPWLDTLVGTMRWPQLREVRRLPGPGSAATRQGLAVAKTPLRTGAVPPAAPGRGTTSSKRPAATMGRRQMPPRAVKRSRGAFLPDKLGCLHRDCPCNDCAVGNGGDNK